MIKVLVTGAYGFVGQHLTQLLQKDFSLITPNHHELDITSFDSVKNLIRSRPLIIVHLAGLASTWQETEENLMKVNFGGTDNLYQAVMGLKKVDGYNPRILFISSSDVYGECQQGDKLTENSPLNPLSAYARSKAKAEQLSFQLSHSNNLNIAVIRPFPHIGNGQKKGFFVPDMASQIVEIEKDGKNEILVGNLDAVRDYSHVKDVVAAYKKIMGLDFKPGEVFNVCSGKPVKIADLLTKLLSLSTRKITVKNDPERMRQGEASFRVGDNSKLIKETGWQPQHTVEEALKDCLEYYRQIS